MGGARWEWMAEEGRGKVGGGCSSQIRRQGQEARGVAPPRTKVDLTNKLWSSTYSLPDGKHK